MLHKVRKTEARPRDVPVDQVVSEPPAVVHDKFMQHFLNGFMSLRSNQFSDTVLATKPTALSNMFWSRRGFLDEFPDGDSESGSDVGDADPRLRDVIQPALPEVISLPKPAVPNPPVGGDGGDMGGGVAGLACLDPVPPPPVPVRANRQIRWSRHNFKLARLASGGWGATCGRHTNAGSAAVCKITLQLRGRGHQELVLTDDACLVQVQRWCLAGLNVSPDAADGKSQHMAMKPRYLQAQVDGETTV